MTLTAGDILAAKDFKTKEIEVPAWGGSVFIRTFSGKDADIIEEASLEIKRGGSVKGLRSLFLILSVCDKEGNLLFDSSQAEAIEEKNGDALTLLMNEIMSLNFITEEEIDKLEKK